MGALEFEQAYEPREDSYLLQKYVKKYAQGLVLDMGTGSGIQAVTAASKENVKKVIAIDISKRAIEECKKKIANNKISKKIEFKQSDLFEYVPMVEFDIIIFNPPYLPGDVKLKDLTIYGGKRGYETIKRFLNGTNNYLKNDGKILLLFSSLTKQDMINKFLEDSLLTYKLLEKQHIFFEDLFVYLVEKSGILKEFEKRKLHNIKLLKKGNRGIVYTANYYNKRVAIKVENKESRAIGRIYNELKWLRVLNKLRIGPKLLFWAKRYIIEEFIEGDFIVDFLQKSEKNKILLILKDILKQCYKLDRFNVNKYEMQRPYKHIIVNKAGRAVMLDFERCKYVKRPKNVTQFLQFLGQKKINEILHLKGIILEKEKLHHLAKEYKYNNVNISNEILGYLIRN